MKNKRLEIVTCRLAGGGGARVRVPPPPLDPGLSGLSNLNVKIYQNFIYICNLKDKNMQI